MGPLVPSLLSKQKARSALHTAAGPEVLAAHADASMERDSRTVALIGFHIQLSNFAKKIC